MTAPMWEPVFEPDAAMLSNIGDGAIKINQAVPGYFNADNLRALTGIERSSLATIQNIDTKTGAVKQAFRKVSTYEITSVLEKHSKGLLTYNNTIRMLIQLGMSRDEAQSILDDKDI